MHVLMVTIATLAQDTPPRSAHPQDVVPLHRLATELRHPHTMPDAYRHPLTGPASLSRSLPGRLFDDGSDPLRAARPRETSPPSTVNATRLDFGGLEDDFGTMDEDDEYGMPWLCRRWYISLDGLQLGE
jgi:hypothetical protein